MPVLNKILVANRGEIACRIIRSARNAGYRTVAVYSDADADARHVREADEAVPIGPAPATESYLAAERLVEACHRTGADAVHPGYGFLSENATFARACAAAGLTFIGPPADAIELMGSKRLSKAAMLAAGVPCIPGYQEADQSDARLAAEAARIGYPVMVKASAGGGGRGMRLVDRAEDLPGEIRTARSEALSAFGSEELILERALIRPRHIEIQVFADTHGNVVHLGERDCSIQRRHQKVIEEAPSPFVTPEMRRAMGEAAVNAARACAYCGAGTVEFLADAEGQFYFLEMNTRLQVEHPVTEMITGLDLVDWQLRVAAGDALPLAQDDIALDGWAIEARLYAEDPRAGFLPQTGTVLVWDTPRGPGLRIDHGLGEGQTIGPHYDPMLAKIIAHGDTRDAARRKLARAVEDTVLLGVASNRSFLAGILRHPVFCNGQATTAFVSDHLEGGETVTPGGPTLRELTLAAGVMFIRPGHDRARDSSLIGWHNAAGAPWHFRLEVAGQTHALSVSAQQHGSLVRVCASIDGMEDRIDVAEMDETRCTYIADGVRRSIRFVFEGETLYLDGAFGNMAVRDVTHKSASVAEASGGERVIAPMDGTLLSVGVAPGERVSRGQTVAVLEAMKMQHQLKAGVDGVVSEVLVSAGSQVRIRQALVLIGADATPPG